MTDNHGDGCPGPDRPAAPCLGSWHQLSAMAANSSVAETAVTPSLESAESPAFRFAIDDGWLRWSAKQNNHCRGGLRTARGSIASPEQSDRQCCHDNFFPWIPESLTPYCHPFTRARHIPSGAPLIRDSAESSHVKASAPDPANTEGRVGGQTVGSLLRQNSPLVDIGQVRVG